MLSCKRKRFVFPPQRQSNSLSSNNIIIPAGKPPCPHLVVNWFSFIFSPWQAWSDDLTDYNLHEHLQQIQSQIKENQWITHFILIIFQTQLPDYYRVWLDLANNLTHLIESRKLRDVVHKVRAWKSVAIRITKLHSQIDFHPPTP